MKKTYRQGDVLLERVDALPKTNKLTKVKPTNRRVILAHGEATGHHHSVLASKATLYREEETQATYLEISEALKDLAQLEHQEHAPIALAPGVYRVVRQREYSPQAIRNVAD